jgi:DNA-binding GntR family transcriptional regulator
MFSAISSLDRESLPEKIAELLRVSFVNGTLLPGTRLVETEIAERMGVSRGPLREALRILQREGLVEARHNRGTYVAEFSEEDVVEIYILRSQLEALAATSSASHASPEQVEQLQGLVDEMSNATMARQYNRAADIDLKMHQLLWEISGNKRLLQFLSSMGAQIRMFLIVNTHLYENLVVHAVAEHQQLVNAIRAGDGERAGAIMRDHILRSLKQTRDFFQRKEEARLNGPERGEAGSSGQG